MTVLHQSTPPETPKKKQIRKFKLDARKEGILLDMAPGDKEYGIKLIEKTEWKPLYFTSNIGDTEIMRLVYTVGTQTYAYTKFRKLQPSGEYEHWTGSKDTNITGYVPKAKGTPDAV